MIPSSSISSFSFQELPPRGRLAALFDDGLYTELVGPFDQIRSRWLTQQGMVPQSDDGVVVARGLIDGKDAVGIAIEPRYEGGSIGEVGGAKIAFALSLAMESCLAHQPIAAVLLLETGGVRVQEATLGLTAIGEIHTAIINLRQLATVVAIVAGPIGCFGGMSLAAALCTKIIATPHGRLGMNGAEVIEQEAGPQELDASDRDFVRQLVGSTSRLRDGFIDTVVDDNAASIRVAVLDALTSTLQIPARLTNALTKLADLRHDLGVENEASIRPRFSHFGLIEPMTPSVERGRVWLDGLSGGPVRSVFGTPSILEADVSLGPEPADMAIALTIAHDPDSILPRAANGELGLEQAWTLAEVLRRIVAGEQQSASRRPILAIVDSPGQAFGRVEEERCISVAAAAVVDAYAAARRAGHVVITLIVGKAMSGAYLAHGMQSDHIVALEGEGVSMHAMNAPSVARITRRTLAEVEANSSEIMPMSYAIEDAYRLGLFDALLPGISSEAPGEKDLKGVKAYLAETLAALRRTPAAPRKLDDNPHRQSTVAVHRAMRDQWSALGKKYNGFD